MLPMGMRHDGRSPPEVAASQVGLGRVGQPVALRVPLVVTYIVVTVAEGPHGHSAGQDER